MPTSHATDTLSADARLTIAARHHDPFSFLGRHPDGQREVIRAFIPGADSVTIADSQIALERIDDSGLFEWRGPTGITPLRYRLAWTMTDGSSSSAYDPYCFPPQLSEFDVFLFGEGNHRHAYRLMGAHPRVVEDVHGTLFSVWAPNAERVSVVGDFNGWDGRRHPMRSRGSSGVWELFLPGVGESALYKFEIRNRDSGSIYVKSDPYGQRFELRPQTASIVTAPSPYKWGDGDWIGRRSSADWMRIPVSIYEVHLGSWQASDGGGFPGYRDLAHRLVDYVREMGFTHIELLPITEHPFDASWGYQTTGYYAPTSRYGSPDDFRYFVDHCHRNGIGVILDWAPAHFPRDAHGLARFDGTALYEHADPRRGEHRDWGTLIFNYGRNEVRNFLVSSALYWLEEFHIDGLRVDAVASMLYLDYSREPGDWTPNIHGGNENLEAIEFLRQLNQLTHELHPGTLLIAEESTSWPMVSRPVWLGGLGFSMKWNMGWMNDTLSYMTKDPVHRQYHHDMLTFSQLYAFSENFVLPLSHDEVVHGKGSLLGKMPGDEWQRHANLRLLFTYMFTHPGKKLLFMGGEFGQGREWDADQSLDWYVLDYPLHQGMQRLVRDLNRLYQGSPALHRHDFEQQGFEWIDCHDSKQSVLCYLRRDGDDFIIVALNFTPIPRYGYHIGVPRAGEYSEILNSDSTWYGGSDIGNAGVVRASDEPWMGRPWSLRVTLPPLGAIVLRSSGG
ncbi:MAG: 1,4-alpha-glucan branching protein GlgB [Gammaproteobacteria bacterium]|jgi:1,4-alpha-glucan branching enzyme|nr:1,4-alpha-glucan branching protein GlgB [Gammaproteobacteria bacterium]